MRNASAAATRRGSMRATLQLPGIAATWEGQRPGLTQVESRREIQETSETALYNIVEADLRY